MLSRLMASCSVIGRAACHSGRWAVAGRGSPAPGLEARVMAARGGGETRSAGPRVDSQPGLGLLTNHSPAAALHSQQVRQFCPGINNQRYWCETGQCCGETGCCTYYYELWWFWLLWAILVLFSCCCAYRHRRAKLRIQQQQRQREIALIAYHGACNYPSSPLDHRLLASFNLPAYEEVSAQPSTPPPSYTSLQRQGLGTELTPSHSSSSVCNTRSPSDPDPGPPLASSVHTALSCSEDHREEEEEDEACSRYRRLTGDSGIEVCRCRVHGDDGEESGRFLHDSPGCTGELHTPLPQPTNPAGLCSRMVTQETPAAIHPV